VCTVYNVLYHYICLTEIPGHLQTTVC
jgi:hypothetical protein